MKKTLVSILSLVALVTFIPMVGLSVAAIWLLITSPVWFGITFLSATTFLVLKSIPIAAAVFAITSVAVITSRFIDLKKEESKTTTTV